MSCGKADKSLKLTHNLSVSLCVRQPHHWLAADVFVKLVTEINVYWCLLVNCTHLTTQQCITLIHSVKCVTVNVAVCLFKLLPSAEFFLWKLLVSAEELRAALYRSIQSLMTCFSIGTLQGFLSLFTKFRKVIVNFIMSVSLSFRPSVWNNSGSTGRIFFEIRYFRIFQKSLVKIKVSWKSDKNNCYLIWRILYTYNYISLSSSQNEKCFRETWHRNSK